MENTQASEVNQKKYLCVYPSNYVGRIPFKKGRAYKKLLRTTFFTNLKRRSKKMVYVSKEEEKACQYQEAKLEIRKVLEE